MPEEERLKLTSHKSVSVHTLYQKQGRPMPIPEGIDLGVMPPGYDQNDEAPEEGSATSARTASERSCTEFDGVLASCIAKTQLASCPDGTRKPPGYGGFDCGADGTRTRGLRRDRPAL